MIKVFLFEECSASGLSDGPKMQDLADEGIAMLLALAQDFEKLPGVTTHIFMHRDYAPKISNLENLKVIWLDSNPDEHLFAKYIGNQDRLIIIAPECDNLLESRTRQALSCCIQVLGSTPQAIIATADKLATFHHLQNHNIQTPFTCLLSKHSACSDIPFPRVIKPIQGAGSTDTFRIETQQEWDQFLTDHPLINQDSFIAQPWKNGISCSVCLFIQNGTATPVISSYQNLKIDHDIQYLGGMGPLNPLDFQRAANLAIKTVGAFPGLAYWVGVDLVLGSNPDGTQDYVLDINPRLTTSYLGARILTDHNLASLWLGAAPKPHLPVTLSTKVLFDKKGNATIG